MALTESEELELLELEEQEAMASQGQDSQPSVGLGDTVMSAVKSLSPTSIAPNLTPEKLSQQLPVIGTVAGGIFGGLGAPIGAGLGQIGKRMAGMAYGTEPLSESKAPIWNKPSTYLNRESIGPMVQSAVAGIPDVSGVFTKGKKTISDAIVSGFSKAGQTLSGVKKDVLEQAHEQGLKTYLAPSVPKAQEAFGKAIGPEGQAVMKEGVEEAFDPALGKARQKAVEIGLKLEKGEPVTALEALQARQATDRVISSTPGKDKLARRALFDWRSKFDKVMASQSGPLKEASTGYRKALVKSQILSPTRLTKSGEPSAFLPMVLGAASIGGYGSGNAGKTTGALASGLAATSPFVWGAGATISGAINPTVRRALLTELIDRVITNRRNP